MVIQERSKLLMRISSKLGVSADTIGTTAAQLGTPRAPSDPSITVDQCDRTHVSETRSPSTFLPSSAPALPSRPATEKRFEKAESTESTAAGEARSDLRSLHA